MKLKRLNNKGASLVFVLVAIAFVSILTAVILSAATTNYRLKVMHNRTQKTFYSAEVALEEVYAGFGKDTCDALEECYLNIAKKLTNQVEIDGDYYAVNIDNAEANKQLKKDFFTKMHGDLCGVGVDLKEVLSAYLTDPSSASVVGYGDVSYRNDDKECYLIIEDVIISYKEGNYDYYSNVAVDISVTYPNEEFDFISNTRSSLQSFLEYSIIAMDGIYVGEGDGTISKGTIAGGAYGGTGITVSENSVLDLGSALLPSTIVSSGDITVYGKLDFKNGDLWCKNFNVGDDAISGVEANFQNNTRVFLADDLNIQGNHCSVTLGKEFIGYGNSGSAQSGSSSAIVINGRGSTFSALSLSQFVLAGRAYINFENGNAVDNYMTADSLGLKGVQKIYLVPMRYMKAADGATGVNLKNPSTDIVGIEIDLDDFFAKELLNDGSEPGKQPYKVVTVEGMNYFYLNFKDTEAQRKYVKCILSDSYFNNNITSKGPNADDDRDVLKGIVTSNMNRFMLSGVIDLGFEADAKYYTAGNLYEVTGGSMNSNDNTENLSDAILICKDKAYRFSVLETFLFDIGRTDTSGIKYSNFDNTDRSRFAIAGTYYKGSEIDDYDAYHRILDVELLDRVDENYVDIRSDNTISAVIVEGTYTVPEGVVGGVIIAYNEDIVVKNSFEGLIITNGKVTTVTDSGELITNGIREVASRILDEDIYLSQFFLSYQMQTTESRFTSNVEVSDILSFDNWRKNYAE